MSTLLMKCYRRQMPLNFSQKWLSPKRSVSLPNFKREHSFSLNSLYSLQCSFKPTLLKTLVTARKIPQFLQKKPYFTLGFGAEFLSSSDGATYHYSGMKKNKSKKINIFLFCEVLINLVVSFFIEAPLSFTLKA